LFFSSKPGQLEGKREGGEKALKGGERNEYREDGPSAGGSTQTISSPLTLSRCEKQRKRKKNSKRGTKPRSPTCSTNPISYYLYHPSALEYGGGREKEGKGVFRKDEGGLFGSTHPFLLSWTLFASLFIPLGRGKGNLGRGEEKEGKTMRHPIEFSISSILALAYLVPIKRPKRQRRRGASRRGR